MLFASAYLWLWSGGTGGSPFPALLCLLALMVREVILLVKVKCLLGEQKERNDQKGYC